MNHIFVMGDIILDYTVTGSVVGKAREDDRALVLDASKSEVEVKLGGVGRVLRFLQMVSKLYKRFTFSYHGVVPEGVVAMFDEFDPHHNTWVDVLSIELERRVVLESKLRLASADGLLLRVDNPPHFHKGSPTDFNSLCFDDKKRINDGASSYRSDVVPPPARCVYLLVDYKKGACTAPFWQPFLDGVTADDAVIFDDAASVPVGVCPDDDAPRYVLPDGCLSVLKMNEDRFDWYYKNRHRSETRPRRWLTQHIPGPHRAFSGPVLDGETLFCRSVADAVCRGGKWTHLVVTCGEVGAVLFDFTSDSIVAVQNDVSNRKVPGFTCGCGDVFTGAFVTRLFRASDEQAFSKELEPAMRAAVFAAGQFAGEPADEIPIRSIL